MEEFPYKLFALKPIAPRWSDLIKLAENANFQDILLKDHWKEALLFLREELGKGFLKTCGINHPLCQRLSGYGELQVKELVAWVSVLRTLMESNGSNYPVLLKKLKSQLRSRSEGIPFLEIARSYLQSGFHVRFPAEIQGQKNPDIMITLPETGESFFVEVSRINDTNTRSVIHEQFSAICNANTSAREDLPYAIKQHLFLDNEQLEAVKERITGLKKEAWEGKKLAYWESSEILMAFVHPQQHDLLEDWCKEKGLSKGISGLSLEFNDTERLLRQQKIRQEAKQIPKGSTGVLYFPIQFLYMMCMDKVETIAAFEKELTAFPNIYGLVLYADVIHPLAEPVRLDSAHIYSIKQTTGGAVRYMLFIQNPYYEARLSEATIHQIRLAVIEL